METKKVVHEIKLQATVVFVLGVMAFALCVIAFKPHIVGESYASTEVHRIAICNHFGTKCADIDGRGLKIRNIGN
ncbi:MAG: hypothetical protein CMK56_00915 [Proteobacteria bacterium]|nr:hypothetical protein [Pseudomonadota bacterium]|tara:strand:- start:2358 stop:2582 length:225 start_codon:yes stop_codon:yes gene_type:complete